MITAFESRATKLTKGEVYVEYKENRWGVWKTYPKKFKSVTQANQWITANIVHNK